MVKINAAMLTISKSKLAAIGKASQAPSLIALLGKEANTIYSLSQKQLPYNPNRKKGKHMKDQYMVSKPKKTRSKINGVNYPSSYYQVRPRGKYQVYYAVVLAGKRNGKPLNYKTPGSKAKVFDDLLKTRYPSFRDEVIKELEREVTRIDKK